MARKSATKSAVKAEEKAAVKKAAKVKVEAAKPAKKAVAKKPAARKAAKAPVDKAVVFSIEADAGYDVYVAGSFNDWNPAQHKLVDDKGEGIYSIELRLAPGDYEYKFVVNGTWCVDPNCKEWVANSLGTLNSVLHV